LETHSGTSFFFTILHHYLCCFSFLLFEKIEIPMKMDPRTKHFICKKCGLYATREQVGDIKAKLNQKEYTKEDRQYDYQEWWQKSKKEKQQR